MPGWDDSKKSIVIAGFRSRKFAVAQGRNVTGRIIPPGQPPTAPAPAEPKPDLSASQRIYCPPTSTQPITVAGIYAQQNAKQNAPKARVVVPPPASFELDPSDPISLLEELLHSGQTISSERIATLYRAGLDPNEVFILFNDIEALRTTALRHARFEARAVLDALSEHDPDVLIQLPELHTFCKLLPQAYRDRFLLFLSQYPEAIPFSTANQLLAAGANPNSLCGRKAFHCALLNPEKADLAMAIILHPETDLQTPLLEIPDTETLQYTPLIIALEHSDLLLFREIANRLHIDTLKEAATTLETGPELELLVEIISLKELELTRVQAQPKKTGDTEKIGPTAHRQTQRIPLPPRE